MTLTTPQCVASLVALFYLSLCKYDVLYHHTRVPLPHTIRDVISSARPWGVNCSRSLHSGFVLQPSVANLNKSRAPRTRSFCGGR